MVELKIFCDEVFPTHENKYIVIGALFVPKLLFNNVLSQLKNARCLNPDYHVWHDNYEKCSWKNNCSPEWHEKNNTVIHFSEIGKRSEKKRITKKWLTLLKKNSDKKIFFKILAIDLNKLKTNNFGNNKMRLTIYNRFFRTLLKGGIKYFYRQEKVVIKEVCHDKGAQEYFDFFRENNLVELEKELASNKKIENMKINFVDDDHRKYEPDTNMHNNSYYIQLIDIILGAFSQLYFHRSKNKDKMEIAEIMRPVFDSISKNSDDYRHSVSIFPKYTLEQMTKMNQSSIGNIGSVINENQINRRNIQYQIFHALRYQNNFVTNIKYKMPNYFKNQKSLDLWG